MVKLQRVALFGATGMVGQGALRQLLTDPEVQHICAIGRAPPTLADPKLTSILRSDLTDLTGLEAEFAQLDAVIFCLGVSALGLDEATYRAVNCATTLCAARMLHRHNPKARFVYVSAKGADASMTSSVMWARVRGELERDLQALSTSYTMVRPGIIMPMDGIVSRTASYRVVYFLMKPLMPVLRTFFPKQITTTQQLGRILVHLARAGHTTPVIENTAFAGLDAAAILWAPKAQR